MKNPAISVVMTVFNGERFIKEAIESVLQQTFSDFEFIIVDNASTDNTKGIVSSYHDQRIILIENKVNLGQTKALNIGIRHARGEFIARMDADDISLPHRLQIQYEYLKENPSISIVGSWHEEINEKGRHIKYFTMPIDPFEIKAYLISPGELGYYCVSHPTVLMNSSSLRDVGFYNERYILQDFELWTRMLRSGYRIANINQFLVKHRVSNIQQTKVLADRIRNDSTEIIRDNILHYLPSLSEKECMILVRMLQFRPQISRIDGMKVLALFKKFFDVYTACDANEELKSKIRARLSIFYLLLLVRKNMMYSLVELLKYFFKYPVIFFGLKLYRKIGRMMIS